MGVVIGGDGSSPSGSAPERGSGVYWQPQPLVDPGSVPRSVPQQVGLLLGAQQ
jgi:hypothetical protein